MTYPSDKPKFDPNVPFIEGPSELEKPRDSSGLLCFINGDRVCSTDCMAYQLVIPEGKDYEGQQWAKCMLLTSAHRLQKHVVALATDSASVVKHLKIVKADSTRVINSGRR